jgi:hypothetical protein
LASKGLVGFELDKQVLLALLLAEQVIDGIFSFDEY